MPITLLLFSLSTVHHCSLINRVTERPNGMSEEIERKRGKVGQNYGEKQGEGEIVVDSHTQFNYLLSFRLCEQRWTSCVNDCRSTRPLSFTVSGNLTRFTTVSISLSFSYVRVKVGGIEISGWRNGLSFAAFLLSREPWSASNGYKGKSSIRRWKLWTV